VPALVDEGARSAVVAAHQQHGQPGEIFRHIVAGFGDAPGQAHEQGIAAKQGRLLPRQPLRIGVGRDRVAGDLGGEIRGTGVDVGEGTARQLDVGLLLHGRIRIASGTPLIPLPEVGSKGPPDGPRGQGTHG